MTATGERRPLRLLSKGDIDRMLKHADTPELCDILLDIRNGERMATDDDLRSTPDMPSADESEGSA